MFAFCEVYPFDRHLTRLLKNAYLEAGFGEGVEDVALHFKHPVPVDSIVYLYGRQPLGHPPDDNSLCVRYEVFRSRPIFLTRDIGGLGCY
ncbi:hypothetical protein ES703_111411 [subsurface metagenome]